MINSGDSELVASCTAIGTQHATNSQFHVMNGATNNATNMLKALASAVLKRNIQRNNNALENQKTTQLITPKNTQLVAYYLKANLSLEAQKSILSWFSLIGETDQKLIDEVLESCRLDPEKLAYFLIRAQEISPREDIQCKYCQHFKCFNLHGGGSGTCRAGVLPLGICHWGNNDHKCGKYLTHAGRHREI